MGKNPVLARISLNTIRCSAYSLYLRLVGFTTEMFSMKLNQKPCTQSSNVTPFAVNEVQIVPLPQCRHFVWKKVCQSHIQWEKSHKMAQIVASLIQAREHKGKWTSFHLLPVLCPMRFSYCHVKSQTSIRSLLLTQLQPVSESVGSPLLTQFERVKHYGMECLLTHIYIIRHIM